MRLKLPATLKGELSLSLVISPQELPLVLERPLVTARTRSINPHKSLPPFDTPSSATSFSLGVPSGYSGRLVLDPEIFYDSRSRHPSRYHGGGHTGAGAGAGAGEIEVFVSGVLEVGAEPAQLE